MAIVKTVTSGAATVHIDDSCCAGLSAAEIARRWAEVDRVIFQINQNHARRMAEAGEATSSDPPQAADHLPLKGKAKAPQTPAD